MKKIFILCLMVVFYSFNVRADEALFAEEIETYGALGGLAYACGIEGELKTYEMIVTDLIHNRTLNDNEEYRFREIYVKSKKRFFEAHLKSPQVSCVEVRNNFLNQNIFRFKKNPDGSMVAPNGDFFKAR